jgi:hypothetical protein
MVKGALFLMLSNTSIGAVLSLINTFADERAVFVREQGNRTYRPVSFFFAKVRPCSPAVAAATELLWVVMHWFDLLALLRLWPISRFKCFTRASLPR